MKKLWLVLILGAVMAPIGRSQDLTFSYETAVPAADRALVERAARDSDQYYRSVFGVGVRSARIEVSVTNGPAGIWGITDTQRIRLFLGSGDWVRGPGYERYRIVAHEMFHLLQLQLSGGRQIPEVWLHEGAAEYMAYRAADVAGEVSYGYARSLAVDAAERIIRPLNLIQPADPGFYPVVFLAVDQQMNTLSISALGEFYARGADFFAVLESFRKSLIQMYDDYQRLRVELYQRPPSTVYLYRLPDDYRPVIGYTQIAFRLNRVLLQPAATCTCPPLSYVGTNDEYGLILYLHNGNGPGSYSFSWQNPNGPTLDASFILASSSATNVIPSIISMSRTSAAQGEKGFELAVNAFFLAYGSQVLWNGSPRPARVGVNVETQILVALTGADLNQPGTHRIVVINPPPGGGISVAAEFTVTPAPTTFSINPGGIVNNASYSLTSSTVAPGSIVAIFGNRLTESSATCLPPSCNPSFGLNGRLNTQMVGTRVLVNGIPAPMFYASPGQLGIQIPTELTSSSASIQVIAGFQPAPPQLVLLDETAPGIFTINSNGQGAGAVTHADGSAITVASPARPGETVVLYATGLGRGNPLTPTGTRPEVVTSTALPVSVQLDGLPVTPLFAGLAGCCVGLNQINFRIPDNVRIGAAIPLSIIAGGRQSNPVTIAIQ